MVNQDNYRSNDMQEVIGDLTRQKVVRQLHDSLTQTVSALAMRINYARRLIATDVEAAGVELEKVEDLTRAATKEIRHIIFLLRSENQGEADLTLELEALASKMGELFDQEIELEIEAGVTEHLPGDVQEVIYRIAEELIDSSRKLDGENQLLLSLKMAENDLVQLNFETRAMGKTDPELFDELVQNNVQAYANLIGGSVLFSGEIAQVQVLFPANQVESEGEPPG
jgi:signal transduction histidine kinase